MVTADELMTITESEPVAVATAPLDEDSADALLPVYESVPTGSEGSHEHTHSYTKALVVMGVVLVVLEVALV